MRRRCPIALGLVLLGSLLTAAARGQTVETLAGGRLSPSGPDAGWVDGNSKQAAQFSGPMGCVVDASGNLLVADSNNGAIRKLDLVQGVTSTVIAGLVHPVAVAVDLTNNFYVLDQGGGFVLEYDRFDRQYTLPMLLTTNLVSPTAFALDTNANVYVTEAGGAVKRIDAQSGAVTFVFTGLRQPNGIAVLDSGLLAVSDTGANVVRLIDPATGNQVSVIGTGVAGYRDGLWSQAMFSAPWQVAKAPDSSLVVADRANERVRIIRPDGTVITLYGVYPYEVDQPCLVCNPVILPGWLDGSVEFAEARDPVGVAVDPTGVVYTTEDYYDLVRRVDGVNLVPGGNAGAGTTNLVVPPPELSLVAGYYPMGVDIQAAAVSTNFLQSGLLLYTTDGSDPSTNNPVTQVITNTQGVIHWHDTVHDLSFLRVKAVVGGQSSVTVSGQAPTASQVGVPSDLVAGAGATLLVPVVADLKPGDSLKSLQFVVQITPQGGALPLATLPRVVAMSPNDFVPLVIGSTNLPVTRAQAVGTGAQLAVAYVGGVSFQVSSFGVVSLLAVAVPPGAGVGDRYTIAVLPAPSLSGTADGQQAAISLSPSPAHSITVANVGYVVGDTAPSGWYDAGTFGDGRLDNSDVNDAFYASIGVRVPPVFTDAFDAMDVFPEDTPADVGGDGKIRFLDWQILLERSLGFRTNNWRRTWVNGQRVPTRAGVNGASLLPTQAVAGSERLTISPLNPQAELQAGSLGSVRPDEAVTVPVFVNLAPGASLAGLQFRAVVTPQQGAPPLDQPLRFTRAPAAAWPDPILATNLSLNEVAPAWSLIWNPFPVALTNRVQVGSLAFTVPAGAQAGQSYALRVANADGAPDLSTQYDFGSVPGVVSVLAPAVPPVVRTYKLRFPTQLGLDYVLESTTNLAAGPWVVEADSIPGRGVPVEYVVSSDTAATRFYRVRLAP